MNLWKMAYRNVSRQKRRSNLLGLAIAFGVMMIVLVNGLTQGLIENTQRNFESALGGHIYISGAVRLPSGKTSNRIGDVELLDRVLAQVSQFVETQQKRSVIGGKFVFSSKVSSITTYGVHWDAEQDLIDSLDLAEGSLANLREPDSILLPEKTAKDLGVLIGETVLLSFETVTGQANVGEFTVIGTLKDASGLGFTAAYTDIRYMNSLLGLAPQEYQSLNLVLKDIALINMVTSQLKTLIVQEGGVLKPEPANDGDMMKASITAMFGSATKEDPWVGTRFDVADLNDYMDMVTQIVAILNGIALGMFLIMLLITMVGLINTFRMIMIERIQEIGTMRAVGMQRKHVSRLFLLEGLILVLRGAFYGVVAALVIGFGISLIVFPSGSDYAFILNEGHITVAIGLGNILSITVIITLITLLAVGSPARKAAKLLPADALRA